MKARVRIIVAALALPVFGGPLLAQEAPPPPQNDVVGNPQLQNFSLNGTVTQPSNAPVPVQQQPQNRPATAATTQPQPQRQAQPDSAAPVRQTASEPESARQSARADPEPAKVEQGASRAPATDSGAVSPQPTGPANDLSGAAPDVAPPIVPDNGGHLPVFPWIVAALALAATAGWYVFLRQRPPESYAGAANFDAFEPAAPAPAPAPPAPAPKATPPAAEPSTGFVSTRLRPWLEIEFIPDRVIVEDDKVSLNFHVSIFNSGSAPARAILLEASLFNAGPQQDQQIRGFFEKPVAEGNRIPVIPPLQRFSLDTAVFLPRDQLVPLVIEGRPLLVPMIGFNALYSWGSGEGQSSASYLVGKQTAGEKLAPFRLDLGARVFRGLAAREHELRVRR